MVALESVIDSIQDFKRMMANRLIKDPEMLSLAHDFLDSQTNFAKTVMKTTFRMAELTTQRCRIFPMGNFSEVTRASQTTDTSTQEK